MLALGPPHGGFAALWEENPMADLAYVLLAIAGFALLALTLRGLDAL